MGYLDLERLLLLGGDLDELTVSFFNSSSAILSARLALTLYLSSCKSELLLGGGDMPEEEEDCRPKPGGGTFSGGKETGAAAALNGGGG
jgi:hypothetical protein